MSDPDGRLSRLVLLAYPAAFRSRYGPEMLRCMRDLRRHGAMGRGRLAAHVAADVLLTAPRMRMESLMNRTIAITVALSAALLLALVVAPVALVLVPLALVALAVAGRRHDRPIAGDEASVGRGRSHILGGLGSLAVAGAILIADGGELERAGVGGLGAERRRGHVPPRARARPALRAAGPAQRRLIDVAPSPFGAHGCRAASDYRSKLDIRGPRRAWVGVWFKTSRMFTS